MTPKNYCCGSGSRPGKCGSSGIFSISRFASSHCSRFCTVVRVSKGWNRFEH